MTGWKVTATTIFCRDVDDEVTLIMNDDGNISCTGMQRYFSDKQNGKKQPGKGRCPGATCSTLAEHKAKIPGKSARSS